MGHVRLGTLPRSRAWKEVVGLITAGADVSQIANATIRAADKAFSFVLNDEGYTEAVWLMTQLAIAAKKDNFSEHLAVRRRQPASGYISSRSLPPPSSEALDQKLESNGGRFRPWQKYLSEHWLEPWWSTSPQSCRLCLRQGQMMSGPHWGAREEAGVWRAVARHSFQSLPTRA